MSYEFLDHTADVKFEASGKTLEEAFSSSLDALKETISGDIFIVPQIDKEMSITGSDLNNLLYKFLEEFLFLLDSEDFLVSKIKKIEINEEECSLKATIAGDKAENYNFTNDVKAVTYNEMVVRKDANGWIVEVVLDV